MPSFGKLFWLNTSLLIGWVFFALLSHLQSSFSLTSAIFFLTVSLPLFGTNITAILEKISKIKFSSLERITIISLVSFTLPPLIITLFFSYFDIVFPTLPILLTGLSFVFALYFNPFFLEERRAEKPNQPPVALSLFISLTTYCALVAAITSAYYPLPDLDSYYWYKMFQDQTKTGVVTAIALHRPLFSSLTYIFHVGAGIDLYAFFKYILPASFLLVLIPTSLLASKFQGTFQKVCIHFFPLSSASFILYSLMPIPQTVFNTGLVFFICLTLYSWITGYTVFYLLAGLLALIMIFYHELSIFVFLPWMFITLLSFRSLIYEKVKSHKTITLLLLIIILSQENFALHEIIRFTYSWTEKIIGLFLHPSMNLTFPISYINIDGNAVGWGSWLGSLKYYSFYAGPITILSILFLTVLTLKQIQFLKSLITKLSIHREILINVSLFAIFFLIAEIFPRFFNVALFPERAWGFAALFILPLALLGYKVSKEKFHSIIASLFIAGILLNIGAAIYINSQKKYLITPNQIQSAEWIKDNLPSERIIFGIRDYLNLIRVHSQSEFFEIPQSDFFLKPGLDTIGSEPSLFSTQNNTLEKNISSYQKNLSALSESLGRLERIPIGDSTVIKAAEDVQKKNLLLLESIREYNKNKSHIETAFLEEKRPAYVYYAEASTLNPYINRPYAKKYSSEKKVFIFDQYPQKFQRIYSLEKDEVVIWKVLQ